MQDEIRLSDYRLVAQEDDAIVLKARDEVGRGKRFGMDGEIRLDEEEAETFAKWVFTRDLDDMDA